MKEQYYPEGEIGQTNRQLTSSEAPKPKNGGNEPEVVKRLREEGYVFVKVSDYEGEYIPKRNPI